MEEYFHRKILSAGLFRKNLGYLLLRVRVLVHVDSNAPDAKQAAAARVA